MSLSCHKMRSLLTLLFCSLATARVMVDPHVYIAVLRGSASFVVPPTLGFLHGATWTLNGNVLQEGQNVAMLNIFVSMSTIIGLPYLNISNIPAEYNNSVVGCEAYLNTRRLVTADEAILRLQGPLAAIVSLTLEVLNSTIFLAWHPPFTLDIRGLDPDITYYVTIVGQNISGDEILVYKRNITETHFNHLLPHRWSWCYNIYANVTPVNPAGNGESFVKPWNITDQSPVLVPPPTYLGMTDIELNMSAPVCTAELVFVDLDTGESITLGNTDLTVEENSITFTTDLLTADRYNATIRASNAAGSSISYFNLNFSVEVTTYISTPSSTSEAPVNGTEKSVTEKLDGDGLPTWLIIVIVLVAAFVCGVVLFSIIMVAACLYISKNGYSSPLAQDIPEIKQGQDEDDKNKDSDHEQEELKTTDENNQNVFVSGDSFHRRSSCCVVPCTRSWQKPPTDTSKDTNRQETQRHSRLDRTLGGHDNHGGEPRDDKRQRQEAVPFSTTCGDEFLLSTLSKDVQAAGARW